MYNAIFWKLCKSKFRRGFSLKGKDLEYARKKGTEELRVHARDFVERRLAPAEPKKDGKQTPFRGHPVFIAQHATATCCRSCLATWHGIAKGKELTTKQKEFVVGLIMEWIEKQVTKSQGHNVTRNQKTENK